MRAAEHERPLAGDPGKNRERNRADQDEHRAVPPCHRDGFLVLLVDQVIGLVRLESAVVDDGVGVESVAEFPDRPVHHVFMKGPFEKRGEDDTDGGACEAPEDEKCHE